MTFRFTVEDEVACSVALAVAVYLDAEHYVHLHRKFSDTYDILAVDAARHTIWIRESWRLGALRLTQTCRTIYVPPATFINDEVWPEPRWVPSIHHVMRTTTTLTYTPTPTGCHSTLVVECALAWWLWPLRRWLATKITHLKRAKDAEDWAMIARQQSQGRDPLVRYRSPSQFLLHKGAFLAAFPESAPPFGIPCRD